MKGRLILAFVLVAIAVLAITAELIYIKKNSDDLSYRIDEIIELLSEERFREASSAYLDFYEVFARKENAISIFIHDKAVDDIHDLVYETHAYFLKENTSEFFEYEDIVRNLEKIKIKINDIYASMIPDLKNLM